MQANAYFAKKKIYYDNHKSVTSMPKFRSDILHIRSSIFYHNRCCLSEKCCTPVPTY